MERTIRSPVTVILLSIITCGIYGLYWQWVTNQQINDLLGKQDVGGGMLILGWFCFPVLWYTWYKWDKSLLDVAERAKVRYSSNFILWIVLTIAVGLGFLVSMFQIQDTLNSIYDSQTV